MCTGRAAATITLSPIGTETPRMSAATPLLHLMWLASPALPVGGFSYSEGLEAAVEVGSVSNEAQAGDWLLDQLQISLARADLPVLAQAALAWAAWDAAELAQAEPEPGQESLQALNDWLVQSRETAELRAQTEQMGRSLLDWLRNSPQAQDPRLPVLAALQPAPTWPLAFALATVLVGATPRDALLTFAWGWAENMAQAAMKAVPLGQAAAQRILSRLAARVPEVVDAALALSPSRRQAFSPMLAILSAQHETQYSRLFRS